MLSLYNVEQDSGFRPTRLKSSCSSRSFRRLLRWKAEPGKWRALLPARTARRPLPIRSDLLRPRSLLLRLLLALLWLLLARRRRADLFQYLLGQSRVAL